MCRLVVELGIMDKYLRKYSNALSEEDLVDKTNQDILELELLEIPFFFAGVSCAIAAAVFLVELVAHKRKKRRLVIL